MRACLAPRSALQTGSSGFAGCASYHDHDSGGSARTRGRYESRQSLEFWPENCRGGSLSCPSVRSTPQRPGVPSWQRLPELSLRTSLSWHRRSRLPAVTTAAAAVGPAADGPQQDGRLPSFAAPSNAAGPTGGGVQQQRSMPNRLSTSVGAAAAAGPTGEGGQSRSQQSTQSWASQFMADFAKRRQERETLADRAMAAIVNSGGAVVGSYMADPVTFLHRLDPRVKQVWLLALVALPARSGLTLRVLLCLLLVAITATTLPRETSTVQLRRTALLSAFLFLALSFGSDGVPTLTQSRDVPSSIESLPSLTQSAPASPASLFPSTIEALSRGGSEGAGYRYVLFSLGPLQLTRRGARLAAMAASLSFIVLQSAALSLTTTTPEATAGALRWLLAPLRGIGVKSDSIVLVLLLSLRFMGLVFEEVRNLTLGVVARGIEWKKLQLLGTLDLFFSLAGRLFQNLFSHADQIAQAMIARGFRGDPTKHQLHCLGEFGLRSADYVALSMLALITAASAWSGLLVPA